MRKLVYYVGMSIDGYIAGPEGQIDLYPVTQDVVDLIVGEFPDALPTHVRAQLGVDAPNPNFAVTVMGGATYAPALEIGVTSPYAHLRQYVVSESSGRARTPQWRSSPPTSSNGCAGSRPRRRRTEGTSTWRAAAVWLAPCSRRSTRSSSSSTRPSWAPESRCFAPSSRRRCSHSESPAPWRAARSC
ncbi:hypothetical protein [Nocardiopsis sp. CNR-923]|uniref:hypothetical protein n=1 Tax=Nocardiopsis sp. CNR-923 TaxID=1904965 RepID=UPI002916E5B6|nr:hypothetical protein [Nocardiopsis sp. CNR-923]